MNKPTRDHLAHELQYYIRDGGMPSFGQSFSIDMMYFPADDDPGVRCLAIGNEGDYRLAMCRKGWNDGFNIIQEGIVMSLEAFFYEQDQQDESRQGGA